MICLDNTDTLEGGASVDAVVDYTVHGLVGSTFTVLADGQLSDTDPSVLYTAGAAISIVSITLVNTHSAAVTVNLYLDSANGGNPRRMIPKAVSLGIGYSLHFDGQRCTVVDVDGQLIQGFPSPLGPTKGGTGLATYTKGDLLYSSANNVLGALGIGTANYKLFTNAAGDLPEWAVGLKVGTFLKNTADASGPQVIGGVGFKPSCILFFGGIHTTVQGMIGIDDGTTRAVMASNREGTADAWYVNASQSLMIYQAAGVHYLGTVTTLGADGFTITWVKTGAKVGSATIGYLAIR